MTNNTPWNIQSAQAMFQASRIVQQINQQNAEVFASLAANIGTITKPLEQVSESIHPIVQQFTKINPVLQKQLEQLTQVKLPPSFTQQYSEIFKTGDIIRGALASLDFDAEETVKQLTNDLEDDHDLRKLAESVPEDSAFSATMLYLCVYWAGAGNLARDPQTARACGWIALIFGLLANYSGNNHLNAVALFFGFIPAVLPKEP